MGQFSYLCLVLAVIPSCLSLQPCGYVLEKSGPLLALICNVFLCFCQLPNGVLGQVWYLIVSIPDICLLSFFFIYVMSCERCNMHSSIIDILNTSNAIYSLYCSRCETKSAGQDPKVVDK